MIDMKKINAALERLEPKQKTQGDDSQQKNRLWKPDAGKTKRSYEIRIVPIPGKSDELPFIEMYFHYGINGNFLCPARMKSEDCIMCEFATTIWQDYAKDKQGEDAKEKLDLFKKIASSLRIYTPIVVRGEEDQGVRWLGLSKTVYVDILKNIKDAAQSNIDILDLRKGRDFKYEAISKVINPPYGKTDIKLAFADSSLAASTEEVKTMLETVPDLYEIFKFKSREDMKKALDTYLDPSLEFKDTNTDVKEGTIKNFSTEKTVVEDSSPAKEDSDEEVLDGTKVEDDIEKQFEELMAKGKKK